MKNYTYALLSACLYGATSLSAQTFWTGTASTCWNTSPKWTIGVPSTSVDAIIVDAHFTGTFQPSFAGNDATCKALNIETCVNALSPPPIQFLYFTAEPNEEDHVNLEWATAVEINNDYFIVERTADGINYETVAVVQGAGSSSQQHHYTALDPSPLVGLSFYRLKQTDVNGTYTYSNLQSVTLEQNASTGVYPNPSDGSTINLSVEANADDKINVILRDASGKQCYSHEFVAGNDGPNNFRIDFPSVLEPGIYFVYIQNQLQNSADPLKLVVQ